MYIAHDKFSLTFTEEELKALQRVLGLALLDRITDYDWNKWDNLYHYLQSEIDIFEEIKQK